MASLSSFRTPIVLVNGPAIDFRDNINTNFENIKQEFNHVYDVMVDIKVSPTVPADQKIGDFWFKEV